jgi:hydroxyacylglutathione hydrolase
VSGVVHKPLDVQWIHGSPSSKHNVDPDLQIHWYDENTVVLRRSTCRCATSSMN